jgi:hypothetical protein
VTDDDNVSAVVGMISTYFSVTKSNRGTSARVTVLKATFRTESFAGVTIDVIGIHLQYGQYGLPTGQQRRLYHATNARSENVGHLRQALTQRRLKTLDTIA